MSSRAIRGHNANNFRLQSSADCSPTKQPVLSLVTSGAFLLTAAMCASIGERASDKPPQNGFLPTVASSRLTHVVSRVQTFANDANCRGKRRGLEVGCDWRVQGRLPGWQRGQGNEESDNSRAGQRVLLISCFQTRITCHTQIRENTTLAVN